MICFKKIVCVFLQKLYILYRISNYRHLKIRLGNIFPGNQILAFDDTGAAHSFDGCSLAYHQLFFEMKES